MTSFDPVSPRPAAPTPCPEDSGLCERWRGGKSGEGQAGQGQDTGLKKPGKTASGDGEGRVSWEMPATALWVKGVLGTDPGTRTPSIISCLRENAF